MSEVESREPRLGLIWPNKDAFLLVPKDATAKPIRVERSHPAASEVRLTDLPDSFGDVDDPDPFADNLLFTGDSLDMLRVLAETPEYRREYWGKAKPVDVTTTIPYDGALVEEIAYTLNLREPNERAMDTLALALDGAEVGQELIADLATGVGKRYIAGEFLDDNLTSGHRKYLRGLEQPVTRRAFGLAALAGLVAASRKPIKPPTLTGAYADAYSNTYSNTY
jgi:hypothetical protein